MEETKTCTKCNKIKPLSEFNKRKASKDGELVSGYEIDDWFKQAKESDWKPCR